MRGGHRSDRSEVPPTRLPMPVRRYSAANAITGSTRAACRAGTQHATAATIRSPRPSTSRTTSPLAAPNAAGDVHRYTRGL
jgi:hypothetical protein